MDILDDMGVSKLSAKFFFFFFKVNYSNILVETVMLFSAFFEYKVKIMNEVILHLTHPCWIVKVLISSKKKKAHTVVYISPKADNLL